MPSMSLAPGEVFAGFTIERELGAGGMGVVYLARHPRLPRHVALKLLRTDLGADTSFVSRFRREAETVARLDHPNIVSIDDSGADNGRLWISMRFIDGTTAAEALAGHPDGLDPARVVHIIERVAAALDFAHRHRVVHRDVKPANILLTDDPDGDEERVYLTDFGVAKAMDEIEAQATSLTTAGGVVATLDYAAPEQIEGKPLDGRCDIYALGCVLYKLLTGVIPFPGETLAAKVYARMHNAPPVPSELVPGLPSALDQVVSTALAMDPADRYQTCKALAVAARAALGTPPRGSTRTEWVGDPDATKAVNYSPGAERSRPQDAQLQPPARTFPPDQYSQPPWDPRRSEPPRPEPARFPGSGPQQYGQQPTQWIGPYTGPGHGSSFTSADSLPADLAQFLGPNQPPGPPRGRSRSSIRRRRSWLAVGILLLVAAIVVGVTLVQRSGVKGTAGTGTNAVTPAVNTAKTPPKSTAKSTVASSSPPQSSASSSLVSPPNPTTVSGVQPPPGLPFAAPLGKQSLVVARQTGKTFALYTADVDTNTLTRLAPDSPLSSSPVLSVQRGTAIYIQGTTPATSSIHVVKTDGSGDDRVLFKNPEPCAVINDIAWNSADQNELALTCTSTAKAVSLLLVDLEGNVIRTITPRLQVWDDITFSADGKLLAFWGQEDGTAATHRLYTLTTDGITLTPITEPGSGDSDPDFSPTGDEIAFARPLSRDIDGTGTMTDVSQIAVVSAKGGEVTQLTDLDSSSAGPSWSPDGKKIAFKNNGSEKKFEIWTVSATTPYGPVAALDGQDGVVTGSPTWSNR